MKVLHVLTFVAPGNPFGGPVRVAMNEAEELRRRGHDVTVVAAQPQLSARGSWTPTGIVAFDSRRVLKRSGFSGIASLTMSWYLWRHVRQFDVVHIHMSRDLVTMPAATIAMLRGVPYVLQTHGMIEASGRKLARAIDLLATRRIVRHASHVFVLSPGEMTEMRSLMGRRRIPCDFLQNGLKVRKERLDPKLDDEVPEVLFCSRLHIRKRPLLFAEAAIDLLRERVDARFVIVGPDEGELSPLRRLLEASGTPSGISVEDPLDLDAVSPRLERCSFLVLPAVDEPFGMIVIEALAAGRPVVVTETCGLADFVREHSCGEVVRPDDRVSLTGAMRRMIRDGDARREMGMRGVTAVAAEFGIGNVVDTITEAYSRAIKRYPRSAA